ncbi:MAG: hypothetical protein AAF485_10305, partial [Chloroflexota bacterium]
LMSIALTVWVGRTLFNHGRIFILDIFNQDEMMTDSINNLVLVGFYLITFAIISLFLRAGGVPTNALEFIEQLSVKMGVVLFLLGVMHLNMFNLGRISRNALKKRAAENGPPKALSAVADTLPIGAHDVVEVDGTPVA